MPIERSSKHPSSSRLAAIARRLLDESKLCAIATVSPGGGAHVNTAYFAEEPPRQRLCRRRGLPVDAELGSILFDERVLGGGTFVTVSVQHGRVKWEKTESFV